MNPKIKSCYLKCPHCGHRQSSPIQFGDVRSFETGLAMGNKSQCRQCGKMIDCNKANMSYVLADDSGGSVGPDFGKSS